MQFNQDLNSNLIKSLTSVHLPPPPSSHMSQQAHHPQSQQLGGSFQAAGTNEIILDERVPLKNATDLNITTVSENYPRFLKASKRRSNTTDELSLPLTTPPHTVGRNETRPVKKNTQKIDDTPLNTGRSKKQVTTQNPLSPQYSSPSSTNISSDPAVPSNSSTKKVTKPPQPTFISRPKSPAIQQEVFELPSPSKMPKIVHDSDAKPPYSYATLIGMAILRGEDRKLTLSQIYSWISSTFKYYRRNDVGWQNSIRHNLSLNKAFVKTEKSSDGKGHYWEIVKGFEMQFVKGKSGKRSFGNLQFESGLPNIQITTGSSNNTTTTTTTTISEPATKPVSKDVVTPVQKSTNKRLSSDTASFKKNNRINKRDDDDDDDDDDSEFESDDDEGSSADELSKTPKSQIRSIDNDLEERPSLKKSHTAIGLQRFSLPRAKHLMESDDEEDGGYHEGEVEDAKKLPRKKLQTKSVSTGNGSLRNIPSLQAPDTTWAASASGDRVIFGQIKPDITIESPKNFHHNNNISLPLPYTSSFSCNTNFELSPLKRQETGPLLEPLTPSSRLTSFNTTTSTTTAATSNPSNSQQHISTSALGHGHNSINPTKTPLRSTTSSNIQSITNSGLVNSAQASHFYNFIKTPTSRMKTPNSNSIVRKFWNSPSFIDDFYTSPSIPRNSDDDYHKSFFGSPNKKTERKSAYFENSGTYGFSDLFGVDICSVVKRAVESVNDDNKEQEKHSLSTVEQNGSSTDDDFDGNTTV